MKTFKCLVCGYIHQGDQPPEKCPKCGADKTKFVEITGSPGPAPSGESLSGPSSEKKQGALRLLDGIAGLMVKHHAHPIAVHVPNGVIPLALILCLLAACFQNHSLAQAAFYNLVFVLLAMPLVLISGYLDWKARYQGNRTPLFSLKMACGAVVTLCAAILVGWFLYDPRVVEAPENRTVFLGVHGIMLAAAALAGHLGGKLVFNGKHDTTDSY